MRTFAVLFTFSLLVFLSHAIELDFCIGDPSLPRGPTGYSCKDPSKVTVDDFVYTCFCIGGPTTNVFKNNVNLAFSNAYPALNSLGISMARLDLGVGGVIPIHTHRTSEVLILVKGSIIAGFIDTNNTAYYKKLQVGDVMISPEGMLHFQVNVGDTPALAFVSLNGAKPTIQVVACSLFASNLPVKLIEQTTLMSPEEVRRLKLFGIAQ